MSLNGVWEGLKVLVTQIIFVELFIGVLLLFLVIAGGFIFLQYYVLCRIVDLLKDVYTVIKGRQ